MPALSRRPSGEAAVGSSRDSLFIECASCVAAGPGCGDCMLTALLGPPTLELLDDETRRALDALAGVGLVPPLRLVREEG